MYKIIPPNSFNFNMAPTTILPISRRGIVDRGFLLKRGSEDMRFDFERDPKYEYAHVVAVGDGEVYGSNANADYFPRAANKQYYHTFVKHAKHYHEHDRSRPISPVVWAGHNDKMGRIETVIALDRDKCADEIHKIASDQRVDYSMAARVPSDFCSICGHEAKHRRCENFPCPDCYCEHLSYYPGRITKEGKQVYAINKQPTFIDVSYVHKGADRVAVALYKLASESGTITGAELAERVYDDYIFDLTDRLTKSAATALLHKLATIEKTIPAVGKKIEIISKGISPDGKTQRVVALIIRRSTDPGSVFKDLIAEKVMLTPEEFVMLGLGSPVVPSKLQEPLSDMEQILPYLFSCLEDYGLTDDIVKDIPLDFSNELPSVVLDRDVKELGKERSLEPEAIRRRAVRSTITGESKRSKKSKRSKRKAKDVKEAADKWFGLSKEATDLAIEYARYQLGFLLSLPASQRDKLTELVVLHNHMVVS